MSAPKWKQGETIPGTTFMVESVLRSGDGYLYELRDTSRGVTVMRAESQLARKPE
jgi:hypothetical protein